MRKALWVMGLWACDSGSSSGDAGVVDAGSQPPPAFVVRVDVDSGIGAVGQAFTFRAVVGGAPIDEPTFTWSAPGMLNAAGSEAEVRFAEAGPHEVSVVVRAGGVEVEEGAVVVVYDQLPVLGDVDGGGTTDGSDLSLLDQWLAGSVRLDGDAEGRADLDRSGGVDGVDRDLLATLIGDGRLVHLSPATGSRGTAVQIIHPLLSDPAARPRVTFAGTEVPVTRGPPGYALIIVPLEATAGAVEIGLGAELFAFQVLDPPTVSGDELPEAYARVQAILDRLPTLFEFYLTDLGLPEDQRATMTALLMAVSEELSAARADFDTAWAQLSAEQRAIYAEVAVANGLGDALTQLAELESRLQNMSKISTERLIALVCAARDLSSVVETISKVNDIAAYVIDALWFLSFFIPPLAPVVATLGSVGALIGTIMDVLSTVLEFVPRFGDTLDVKAMPTDLPQGETTMLIAGLQVQIAGGLCAGGAALATSALIDRLKDKLFDSVFGRVPGFGKIYNRLRNQRTLVARMVNSVVRFLGQIIDVVVDATGIGARISDLAAAVCDQVVPGQSWPLEAGGVTWGASCGTAGPTWTCTQECGDQDVRIEASIEVCGETLRGQTTVRCGGCRDTCPMGCCTPELECIPYENQDVAQCGAMGQRCGMCEAERECSEGMCRCVSTCREGEAPRCADGGTAETCQMVEAGCWRWTPKDCAAGGGMCEEGRCMGGCGDWNCGGCCVHEGVNHTCVDVNGQSERQCGSGGGVCSACAEGDACVAGRCECRGPDCDPRPPAGSRGDPHLATLDRLAYDFQAAGEFVLVVDEAAEGANRLEIQVRQVPTGNGPCGSAVSINVGVAARLGNARVSYVPDRAQVFWIDGQPVELAIGEERAVDGGVIERYRAGYRLTWTDGSAAYLDGRSGLDLAVSMARPVIGLLGDGDGDRTNDLRIRGGEILSDPAPFEQFYGAFADSWRVTAETSLFDYGAGENPATFVVPGFPVATTRLDGLDAEARADAEATCQAVGIEDPLLLAACVLDVACTGDPSYAASFAQVPAPEEDFGVQPPNRPEGCGVDGRDLDHLGPLVDFDCPAECADDNCSVWGTDLYTDDSCICRAAIHAGVLAAGVAGRVRFEVLGGRAQYQGSARNGVSTVDWGDWGGTFRFPALSPCMRSAADRLMADPEDCRAGDLYCHDCPADCAMGSVWGTDVYAEASSLCSAALHAGRIEGEGGRVFFQPEAVTEPFVGSARNGVESLNLDRDGQGVRFFPAP